MSMSMPCIIGAAGVERVLVPPMSADEAAGLGASAAKLRAAFDALQKDLVASAAGEPKSDG